MFMKHKKLLPFQYRLFMKKCQIIKFQAPVSKNQNGTPAPIVLLPYDRALKTLEGFLW